MLKRIFSVAAIIGAIFGAQYVAAEAATAPAVAKIKDRQGALRAALDV